MATEILVLVGGISRESLNKKVFTSLQGLSSDFQLSSFDISTLPFFSQDLEADPPKEVKDLRAAIKKAKGVLFITPEYNRSIPGVLKNAIDWGSRPYGQNSFDGKPAGMMGASVGNIGTFGAQAHLKTILLYLNMKVMGQPEVYLNAGKAFDDKGTLVDDSMKRFLEKLLQAFAKHVEAASS